jgi:hypothetical protein
MGTPFKFKCGCGKSLAADVSMAGKRAKCPNCGKVVQIPAPPKPKKSSDDELEMLPIENSPVKPKPAATSPAQPARRPNPAPQAASGNRPPPLPPGRAAAPAAAPVAFSAAAPAGGSNSIWDEVADDDFKLQAAAVVASSPCPKCGASMSSQAVLCIACGYNKKTGVAATTTLAPLPSKGSSGKKSSGLSLFKRKRREKSPEEQNWWLPIVLVVAGIAVLVWGFREKSLADASSQEPERISLQQLLARGADGNPNLILTDYQICDNFVYEGRGVGDTVIGSWEKVWIPIIVRGGDPFNTTNPQALIYTTRVKKAEDCLPMLQNPGQLRGMVTNRITSIPSKYQDLLRGAYRNIDFDRCLIFHEGREPKSSDSIMLILLGGGALAVVGGLLVVKNYV